MGNTEMTLDKVIEAIDNYDLKVAEFEDSITELEIQKKDIQELQKEAVLSSDFKRSEELKKDIKSINSQIEDSYQLLDVLKKGRREEALKISKQAFDLFNTRIEDIKERFNAQDAAIIKARNEYLETLKGLNRLRDKGNGYIQEFSSSKGELSEFVGNKPVINNVIPPSNVVFHSGDKYFTIGKLHRPITVNETIQGRGIYGVLGLTQSQTEHAALGNIN